MIFISFQIFACSNWHRAGYDRCNWCKAGQEPSRYDRWCFRQSSRLASICTQTIATQPPSGATMTGQEVELTPRLLSFYCR